MSEILNLLEKKYMEAQKTSSILIVSGESGIGKSFYIENFLSSLPKKSIIRMSGHPHDCSDYYTINTAIYKLITSSHRLNNEIAKKILQKLALFIPRFGQQISNLIDPNIYSESLKDVIRRAGINTEEPRILEIIKFIEDNTKKKPLVLYCDNIQWFDKSSWNILLQLLVLITDLKWFCLLSYTTNAESYSLSRQKINDDLSSLKINPDIYRLDIYNMEKQKLSDIKHLCDDILECPTNFSESQYNLIYIHSQGIPLYVKIILNSLEESKHICNLNNLFITHADWESENIRNILKDSLKNKINKVYKTIPQSRDILELGSVINDEFTDETINTISNNNCSEILLETEEKFRLIEHIIENKLWKFEHFLIKDYIYNSLGKKVQELHLKVAGYLETKTDMSLYSKISLHYKLGGNDSKSASFYLKEITCLLDSGCYQSAYNGINYFIDNYAYEILINNDLNYEFLFLKGRCMFHNVQYLAAIEIFTKLINENKNQLQLAYYHQWIARSLLKLDSQSDFNSAVKHLDIAKLIFEKLKLYSIVGDILLDLLVAYAHMNKNDKAVELYKEAEHFYNIGNDKLGMLRLHRKCIIFMDYKLSIPILKKVALNWKDLNVPHEQIMALTNAAAGCINSYNYNEAEKLLLEALTVSIDIGNFGQVYIYNNLGILNVYKQQYDRSEENFNEARKGKYRFVEQLIVNVNSSVLIALKDGINVAYTFFEKTYIDSLSTGENVYIIPASVNWGIANYEKHNISLAYDILLNIELLLTETYYISNVFLLWYNTLHKCMLKINPEEIFNFECKYNNIINKCTELNNDNNLGFEVITMEFWSEN